MLQVQGGLNFPFESPWRNAGPTLFSVLRPLQAGGRTRRRWSTPMQAEIAKVAERRRAGGRARARQDTRCSPTTTRGSSCRSTARTRSPRAAADRATPTRSTRSRREIEAVTSADLQRVAANYLTAGNRTVVDRKPAPPADRPQGRVRTMKKTRTLLTPPGRPRARAARGRSPLPRRSRCRRTCRRSAPTSRSRSRRSRSRSCRTASSVWLVRAQRLPARGRRARGARRRHRLRSEGRARHHRAARRHGEGRHRDAHEPRDRRRARRAWARRSARTARPTRSTSRRAGSAAAAEDARGAGRRRAQRLLPASRGRARQGQRAPGPRPRASRRRSSRPRRRSPAPSTATTRTTSSRPSAETIQAATPAQLQAGARAALPPRARRCSSWSASSTRPPSRPP